MMRRLLPVQASPENDEKWSPNGNDGLIDETVGVVQIPACDEPAEIGIKDEEVIVDNTVPFEDERKQPPSDGVEDPPAKRQAVRRGLSLTKKKHPTKYCCAAGCGKSEFETRFHRVPMIPTPLPPDATEGRVKTYRAKVERRRQLLTRLGLGERDGRKDLRYCIEHDKQWSMKGFVVEKYKPYGDISALKEGQIDRPDAPKERELLIQIKAVATNQVDCKRLANLGNYHERFDSSEPLVVGFDASGIVVEVGEDATLFRKGDEVMFAGDMLRPGAFAELALVDERLVGAKPSSLSWSQAAAVPLSSVTAWEALVEKLNLPVDKDMNAGKTILIIGGAGGVACCAVELCKKVLGLTVIASGSRDESVDFVKNLGADHVVNHNQPLDAQLKAIGLEQNVDYILHCSDLDGHQLTESVNLVKHFGSICCLWPSTKLDMMQVFWKSVNFSTVLLFKNVESDHRHEVLSKIAKMIDDGILRSHENQTYPLTVENLRTALLLQATGKCIGKTTLYFQD